MVVWASRGVVLWSRLPRILGVVISDPLLAEVVPCACGTLCGTIRCRVHSAATLRGNEASPWRIYHPRLTRVRPGITSGRKRGCRDQGQDGSDHREDRRAEADADGVASGPPPLRRLSER